MFDLDPVVLELVKPPADYLTYQERIRVGRPINVTLLEGRAADHRVRRYAVRLLPTGVYRAVVLYDTPALDAARVHCCESSRELVRRWLTEHGIPVLRLGR